MVILNMFALSFSLLLKLTQTCPFPPSVLTLSWFPKEDDPSLLPRSSESLRMWPGCRGSGWERAQRSCPETLKQGWGLSTNRVDSKAVSQEQVVRLEWGQAEDWGPSWQLRVSQRIRRGSGRGWEGVELLQISRLSFGVYCSDESHNAFCVFNCLISNTC